MSMYTQIWGLVILMFALIVYLSIASGACRLFRSNRKNPESPEMPSEEEMKPFLDQIDIEKENRARKQWLISLFLRAITFFALMLAIFFIHLPESLTSESSMKMNALIILVGGIILSLPLAILCWITYHCAYKKRGSGWLMCVLIFLPINELSMIAQGHWMQIYEGSSFSWLLIFTYFGAMIFYWMSCLMLYKVNSDREYQKVLALKQKYGPDADGFCS